MKGPTLLEIPNTNRKTKFLTGLTLVELMIVILILSIIFAAGYSVLTMGRTSYHTGEVQIVVQQEGRKAMDKMVTELREASSINPDTFIDGISAEVIRFTLWGETVEYLLNNSQLQRTVGGVSSILANDVEDVEFRLSGGDVVYITLTTRKRTVFGRPLTATLTSQVVLRN